MVEFHDLKNELLKELSSFCKANDFVDGRLYTYKIEVKIHSIRELIPFLKDITTCYMKSPDGSEILGLGSLRNFKNSLEMNNITKLLEENEDLDFLGALPFNRDQKLDEEWAGFNKTNFFIPKFVLVRENNKTLIKVNFIGTTQKSSHQEMNLLTELNSLLSFIHRDELELVTEAEHLSSKEEEWNQLIQKSHDSFSNSELKKVVLARGKTIDYKESIDSFKLFSEFKATSNQYEFFFHIENGPSFISFTPEKLFSLHKEVLVIDSIAGTLKKTKENKGEDLLSSQKDLEEHRFVSSYIKENLLSISSDVTELFKEEVLNLPTLFHIHSRYRAKLDKNKELTHIIDLLHPTPAVGGFPKAAALNFIESNESLNRGLYAGPIGRISKEHSEFAVGIRSLLVDRKKIHFYGGAGIVEKSIAKNEWSETADKIESVQCMI